MVWNKTIFDNVCAYEAFSGEWKMVVIGDFGPRIAFLGKDDVNLLYWDTNPGGSRGEWKLRGGHRVWLSRPYADESEDTYLSDNAPCKVAIGGNTITLTSPAHPVHKLERGMKITVEGSGKFTVTNFVTNAGDLIYSGGVWSPTCINPEGKVLRIPLGTDSTWDVVHIAIPRVFAGNHTILEDSQVSFEGNDLVVRSQGHTVKRCASSLKGIVQLEWPEKGIIFQKQAEYQPFASYPLGCNVACFVGENNWMGEIETFGPEQAILPGATIENTEKWCVFDDKRKD